MPAIAGLPAGQDAGQNSGIGPKARLAAFGADRLVLYWMGLGCLYLIFLYVHRYRNFYALPGNVPGHPEGWWGWFDQGKYIDSARALASFDFSQAHHWYPLGYPLLAAPFVYFSNIHPFALVDLGCLLASYFGFLAFARRVGVAGVWAVPLFIYSFAFEHRIFAQWLIPWNTSLVSALVWVLLACTVAHMQGQRRPLLIGLLAAAIPLVRPTDALLSAITVAAVLIADRPHWRRNLMMTAAGGAVLLAAYGALHLAIYGAAPSEYMRASRDIGFTFHDLGWKAYVMLVDPTPWFRDGMGLLRRAPFLALTLPALPAALWRCQGSRLLGVLLIAHTLLYLSYVDLLPTGLWRYYNVHYWTWAFPGALLLIFLLLKELVLWRRARLFPLGFVSVALSIPLLCIKVLPAQVTADKPAKMLVFPGDPPGFDQSYFAPILLQDNAGEMLGVRNMRAFPAPYEMRVVALTRDFQGEAWWATPPSGWSEAAPPVRYGERIVLGQPCWLKLSHCRLDTNDQLPPTP
jgi:hypothetical protein